MRTFVCVTAILLTFCSYVDLSPDPVAKPKEWRRLNYEKFEEFSQIRHKKTTAQTTTPAHIEYLTKVDIIMTIDREIFAAFNFGLTGLLQYTFDEIWNNPNLKDKIVKAIPTNKREKSSEKKDAKADKKGDKKTPSPSPLLDPIIYDKDDNGHIDGGKIMEKLAGYFDAINSLKQFIEDKEFQHLATMNDLEPFHLALNKSIEEGSNFTPEQLKPVEAVLEREFPKIRKCRQQIVKKASQLRDVCTNDDPEEGPLLFYMSLEPNELLGRIAASVKRYFEPNNDLDQRKLFAEFKPRVDELNEEFTKNAIVKEFIAANQSKNWHNIIKMFADLEESEHKVCDALNSLMPEQMKKSSPKSSPETKKAKVVKK